jgi:hypothetical protein
MVGSHYPWSRATSDMLVIATRSTIQVPYTTTGVGVCQADEARYVSMEFTKVKTPTV